MELKGIAKLAVIFDKEGFDIAINPDNFSLSLMRKGADYEIAVRYGSDEERTIKISNGKAQEYRNKKEFCELFDNADNAYEQIEKENNERRSERRKGIMKKTLRAFVAGMAVVGAAWGINGHYKNPEVQRERELNRKAAYILPEHTSGSLRNQETYSLNGERLTIRNAENTPHSDPFEGHRQMQIEISGICFGSESFDYPDDDARNLEVIDFNNRRIPVEKTKNPAELQKRYETLIECIYDAKIAKEKAERDAEQHAIDQAKDKIQEAAKKI